MIVRFPRPVLALLVSTPALAQQEGLAEVHRMVPAGTSAGTELGAGDVDGDGDLDLVAANINAENLLLLADGNGRFDLGALPPNPASVNNSDDLALGDVDGDGDLDLLFANRGPGVGDPLIGQDRLLLGDGLGSFVDATAQLPVEEISAYGVDLGDVDLDGDLDAAVAHGGLPGAAGAQPSVVLRNDGAGVFTVAAGFAATAEPSRDVLLDDLDGDGDLDLFETFAQLAPRVYRNDGAGLFAEVADAFPELAAASIQVELGDVDGDADLDVVGFNGLVRLWLNDGAGVFAGTTGQVPVPTGFAVDGALADLDGDGDLDIAAGLHGGSLLAAPDGLYANDGAGVFTDASGRLPDTASSGGRFFALDVDRDQDVDLLQVQTAAQQGYVRLYLNDGVDFEDVTSPLGATGRTFDVAVDDLDGDGDLDALVAGAGPGPRLYRNAGAGELVPEDAGLAGAPSLAVAVADVDGDGDSDAFFGGDGEGLFLNDGDAGFAPAAALPASSAVTQDAVLVDVDGDGDLDAFLASTAQIIGVVVAGADRLLLGDGAGGFADGSAQVSAPVRASFAAAPGDVDLDGDLDFLIAAFGPNELLLGDGAGGFVGASAQLPGDSLVTRAAALVDVDGDGDLDALFGNEDGLGGSGQNQLQLGDGTGFFADAPGQVPALLGDSQGLAVGDPDGDGDPDAYFANGPGFGEQADELWLNDGGGSFTLGGMAPVVAPSDEVAFADLDGDGDDDALVCGQDLIGLRQLAGLKRHVAWRAVPRIGKPLAMDLRGDPGSAWVLASSPKSASFDFGVAGVLGIDPSALVTVDAGQLDGEGRALREFQVPADVALVGAELLWQALLGIPAAFTNVERAVFTEL
ncbi:MAG: VCBS repeat-containing protein [Planctomycetota bacterium]